MKGGPLTLLGPELTVGEKAPGFTVVNTDLEDVSLCDYAGKVVIVAAVPSVDTSVCATETRKFNEKAAALDEDVVILTVSMDLPFALGRFCSAEGIEQVVPLSDHRDADFGESYGVLIKDLRLLARSVFVVDREGMLQHVEIVPEVTDEPDYDAALQAASEAI
jgi:thiol peroxidase